MLFTCTYGTINIREIRYTQHTTDARQTMRERTYTDMKLTPEAAEARRQYAREWKSKNRDHLQEYNAKWREEHRDHLREYRRQWQKDNADKINGYNRAWRKKNPDKVREYAARYWSKRADQLKERTTEA